MILARAPGRMELPSSEIRAAVGGADGWVGGQIRAC